MAVRIREATPKDAAALVEIYAPYVRETAVTFEYDVPSAPDAHLTMDSVRFHEKMGYRMVGTFHQCGYKFDTWYDMVWMEKIIGNYHQDQPAIVPYPEIRQNL